MCVCVCVCVCVWLCMSVCAWRGVRMVVTAVMGGEAAKQEVSLG